jgi:hypothetical protein
MIANPEPRKCLRIAVISTPRSGNTWIRKLIAEAYGISEAAHHSLTEKEWRQLPEECVLQIHWRRDPEFLACLAEHGFRILTVARHPLDVLISILHVAIYDIQSEHWLQGKEGGEQGIWGASPRSRAFIDYATGRRAAELLAITCDWWDQPDVVSVRYEDFVADPTGQLARLTGTYGPPRADLAAVVARNTIAQLSRTALNNHFWKGQPGLWRELLPAAEAREIAAAIQPVLDRLGYVCDPNPDLTPAEADRTWVRLVGEELRATLRRETQGHLAKMDEAWRQGRAAGEQEVRALREQRERLGRDAARLRGEAAQLRNTTARLVAELAQVRRRSVEQQVILARRDAVLAQREAVLAQRDAEIARHREQNLLQKGEIARLASEKCQLQAHAAHLEAELVPYRGLKGFSVRIARKIQQFRDRFPRLSQTVKKLLGRRETPAA